MRKKRKDYKGKKYRKLWREKYMKLYRQKNREKITKQKRIWEAENPDKVKEYRKNISKRFYLNNKNKILRQTKEYRKTLKGKIIIANSYRKRRVGKIFTDIDVKWLNDLFSKTTHCELCKCELDDNGKKYPNGKQLDHITPLNVGGTHTKNNVRFICYKCNAERPRDGSDNLKILEAI